MSHMFLLGADGGVVVEWHENADNTATLRHYEDAQPILDNVQRLRGLQNQSAQGRHVASVPATIAFGWQKEWRTRYKDTWSWKTFLTMKLNSRDYSGFRTWEGRV